ncbi:MAG: hypothetical protein QM708_12050 [Propioniciclava sp.]|uniref:hypothetical protein n=1 Tax=Propioniciclava sp. TaxID=2038686 RepID=UPI0039E537F9
MAKKKNKSGNPAKRNLPATHDHQPKAPAVTTIDVELDGNTITVDLAPVRNVRLMRRLKNEDVGALVEFFEGTFGEQLDELEERYNLVDIDEYQALLSRVMEKVAAANPNSRS